MLRKLMPYAMTSMLLIATNAVYAAENYVIDNHHTYVQYHINHLGFSTQSGKWYADGTLVLDKDKPQNSKVNVTINMASLDTGNPELNEHLNGQLFFDTAKYPSATFVSNKVETTGKKSAKVYGTLTLHGVSKPVILTVSLNKQDINPITNKPTVGFSAKTELKRSDYGVTAFLPGLGDNVKIDIEAEAYKAT